MNTDKLTEILQPFLDKLAYDISSRIIEKLPATHKEEEKLYSPEEACRLFHPVISKSTLHNWATQGLIPNQKIGGRIYYKLSDVITAGATLKKHRRTTDLAAV
jgi:Helix-turn-helix domain